MQFNFRQYFNLIDPKYLDWKFYEPFTRREPPFGQLGLVVFLRTYSRFVSELNRREKWCETCLRLVEYSLSLDRISLFEEKKQEAQELFSCLFNLDSFAAGRTYWVGGTKVVETEGSANWNCTGRVVDSISAFIEIYYWLLIGAGTGFSIEEKYISQLPRFYNKLKIEHVPYHYQPEQKETNTCLKLYDDLGNPCHQPEIELTQKELILSDQDYLNLGFSTINRANLWVADSKAGWCHAVRIVLMLLALERDIYLSINYNWIRPQGERLETFGGRASGPQALRRTIEKIYKRTTEKPGQLDSVQCLDIINFIGEGVVAGGVRRSAQIALGSVADTAFIEAKKNLWSDPDKAHYRASRVMSNNSILLYKNPGLEKLKAVFETIQTNGEPGFWCIGNAQEYDPEIATTNPCGESALRNRQSCNLTSNNVVNHVYFDEQEKRYRFDWERWRHTLTLTTRMGSRITTVTQWHPEWDRVQRSQRLLGVSMTGIMEAADLLGWTNSELQQFFRQSADWVREAADNYHGQLGIERSARVTLIKPEGTLSQLPTVSSGIHRSYAPFYLRRIRFSKNDPLCLSLKQVGLAPVPENGQGDDLYADVCNTWIFTFPIKTKAKMRAIDESAIAQLERYKLVQNDYVRDGHNCSITITVASDEWDSVCQWVYENYDSIVGVSFLPRFDPREGGKADYPNLPYESCDEEEYEAMKAKVPQLKEEEFIALIAQYENGEQAYEIDEVCATNVCPVR